MREFLFCLRVPSDHITSKSNFPKFDPYTFLEKGVTTWADSGESHRVWQDIHKKGYNISWGHDPEKSVFEEMIAVACGFRSFNLEDSRRACAELKKHYRTVFKPST